MSFAKKVHHPHPLARRIRYSKKLARAGGERVTSLLENRLAYKLAIPIERAFMQGSGANEPLGLFTADSNGISTGRDISTGNTTTQIKSDNIIEMVYSLKAGYLRKASWIWSRTAMKQIRQLKDGNGRYLFEESIQAKQPGQLMGLPIRISEYCSDTFTSSQYVGILGDFSYYEWCIALRMEIQVLDQLYAETNENGLIGRTELDGFATVEEAFARCQLA
jgi:HK97 family phage major capsid protein